ncbi:MAG: flagellar FliJ family protein [Planctomycetota bacterium]
MAGFVFELEAVLEQRRREEETHQRAVAELERERIALEDEIAERRERIRAEHEALRTELGRVREGEADTVFGGVNVSDLRLQAHASLTEIARAEASVRTLAGLCERLDTARLGLLEAMTRRRALEVLRERWYEAWKLEGVRRENADADDLTVLRAGRDAEERAAWAGGRGSAEGSDAA